MNRASSWRADARAVIEGALREGRALGLEGRALVKFVDARYPWGSRDHWPYKVWLNERALLVFGVRKPMGKVKVEVEAKADDGQPGLFPEEGESP